MTCTVLITDDDPSIVTVFEFMLVKNGFNCIKASKISECVKYIQENHEIDMVFMDFQLHASSIPTGIQQISDVSPKMPVFLMMSYPNDRELTIALGLDAYGIVYKPFDANEVLTLIRETYKSIKT